MKITFTVLAAVFQLAVLSYMGGEREYVLKTGKTVYFKTAPVDPRDIFRGDYVWLNYEASTIPASMLRDGLKYQKPASDQDSYRYWGQKRGQIVYCVFDVDQKNMAIVLYATDIKPKSGTFIRGRIQYAGDCYINVKYGIEAYFVEQGSGREIEKTRSRDDIQIPLEMETAVGNNGIVVLKGHRWTEMGIGVREDRDSDMRLKGMFVKIQNNSDKPLAIVDLPNAGWLKLEKIDQQFAPSQWNWVNENAAEKKLEDKDIKVLQPKEVHETYIDLNDPYWFVQQKDKPPRSMIGLGWSASFRIIYQSPLSDACRHFANKDLIWQGSLKTRTFSGEGRID